MLKSYIDEKGEYIHTNHSDLLFKKASEDMFMNSESPSSFLNLHLDGMGGLGSLGLNVFEDTDKDLMKEMSRYISRTYSGEGAKKDSDFGLQFSSKESHNEKSGDIINRLQDPTLDMDSLEINSRRNSETGLFIMGDELGSFRSDLDQLREQEYEKEFSQYLNKTNSKESEEEQSSDSYGEEESSDEELFKVN
jgi:hypothetical protein